MVKRKAPATGTRHQSKRPKPSTTPQSFVWRPKDWDLKRGITHEVSLLVSRIDRKQLVVKKIMKIKSNSDNDPRPIEIRALSLLPDCNRVVNTLFYSPSDPDPGRGTAFFAHYPLGDLAQWKERDFDSKNHKPIPESFIWRFFLQISQAQAFVQNLIGPNRDQRGCILHRDIKPKNILVVDNGTTYPSFKLHDFGCALMYRESKAQQEARCGTFHYQPPEIPIINTTAAETWALGACVHFLATGNAPIQNFGQYAVTRFNENHKHPDSARGYSSPDHYYSARVPRQVTPINLSREQQRLRGIGPDNHQYSDELNAWMTRCLSHSPNTRPTADRLVNSMSLVARGLLKRMGGKTALVDLDVKFSAIA
ncbi:serine/threonine protein kinase-like protein [Cucurbitaria berberidis CBS 394.84]|uniref:non-specific serine/threonine protein kinase n=1 Tax=Cucurbitaria berberidis CBS 394.84 TaxID=1168544 RepID=A0A9P4GEG9_9PLEO|nr:serine/threonine protein kinase-like protein [Cucurbitaria berberidis CBS 394.84]KAF1843959.1 serine/threonine protein kinase-like protein [Cucurbitaria berberidis CBS 394.84]